MGVGNGCRECLWSLWYVFSRGVTRQLFVRVDLQFLFDTGELVVFVVSCFELLSTQRYQVRSVVGQGL